MIGRVLAALRAVAIACLVASAAAAVPVVDDVRVIDAPWLGEQVTVHGRVDDETPAGSSVHQDVALGQDLHSHSRFGFGVYRSLDELRPGIGSFAYGLEIAEDRSELMQSASASSVISHRIDGDLWLADVFVGWAYALTPWLHLEQGLLAGAGEGAWRWRAHGYLVNGADIDSTSTDFAYEFGFRIGAYWTFARNWQVGVDVRHLVTRSSAHFSASTLADETVSYRPAIAISGLGAVASVGWRF